jgi:hypothetical protein
MLKNTKTSQPHLVFRSSAIEDISIASYFKQKKEKIACLTGDKRIQCRMYKSYQEAMNGFSKNIFMFFGNIPALALLFWALPHLALFPFSLKFRNFSLVTSQEFLQFNFYMQNPQIKTFFYPHCFSRYN